MSTMLNCACSNNALDILSAFGSFIAGIMSSGVIWWITSRKLSPKIEITHQIAKTPKGKYLIGLWNASNKREIYDITVYVRYHFASDNYYASKVEHIPLLKRNPNQDSDNVSDENKPYATKLILDGYKNFQGTQMSVEDFFNERNNKERGFIDIFAIGYDIVSGSTRHVRTQRFYYQDVIQDARISFVRNGMKVGPDDCESGIQSSFYDHNYQTDI